MSSFEEPLARPAPEPEPEPDPKPWEGPPLRMLPGRLADTLVLAHSDRVAITVGAFAVYPNGFAFSLNTVPRRYSPNEWADVDAHSLGRPRRGHNQAPPEALRFGVEFADGGRATSLDLFSAWGSPGETPRSPLMMPRSVHGGGGRWHHDVWVWPLPPPGQLLFVCEWPAVNITLSSATIDASRLHEAAAQSRLLWPNAGEAPPV
jgi:hypothetical protein